LGGPCFLAILLRVEIQCGLDSAVPEKTLHRLWLPLSLVDKPVAERVTEVMKAEALAFLDGYPDTDSRRPQVVGDKDRGGELNPAFCSQRRKQKVRLFGIGRLRAPVEQMAGQSGMERNVPSKPSDLVLPSLPSPAF